MKKVFRTVLAAVLVLCIWIVSSTGAEAAKTKTDTLASAIAGSWDNDGQSVSQTISLVFGPGKEAAVIFPRFTCFGTWTGNSNGEIKISISKILSYNNATGTTTQSGNTTGVSFTGIYEASGDKLTGTCKGSPYTDEAISCSFTHTDSVSSVSDIYSSVSGSAEDSLNTVLNAYKTFLSDSSSFNSLMSADVIYSLAVNPAQDDDILEGFFLYDSDRDGFPELYLEKVTNFNRYAADIVCYKYDTTAGEVVQSGDIISNYTSNGADFDASFIRFYKANGGNGFLIRQKPFLFGYRKDNGDLLSTSSEIDLGGSIDIYEYSGGMLRSDIKPVYEEAFDMTGDMNSGYCNYSQTSGKVYKKIMKSYVPMRFYPVTKANINKYLVPGYKNSGMYKYTLNNCIKDLSR